jgi:hypothetical protein
VNVPRKTFILALDYFDFPQLARDVHRYRSPPTTTIKFMDFFRFKNYDPFSETPTLTLPRNITFTVTKIENIILNWMLEHWTHGILSMEEYFFLGGEGRGGIYMSFYTHLQCDSSVFVCWRCTSVTLHIVGNYSFFRVRVLPFENLLNTANDSRLLFVCTAQITLNQQMNWLLTNV